MMRIRNRWPVLWAGVATSLTFVACSDDPAPQASGRTTPTGQPVLADSGTTAASNQRPVLDSVILRPTAPRPGDTLEVDARALDADGDALSLTYSWRVNGRSAGDGQKTLGLSNVKKGALIEVTVFAEDGYERSEPHIARVRVGNQPPILLGLLFEPAGEIVGDRDIAARPRATDPDADEIEFNYSWSVNGVPVGGNEPRLSSAHYGRGDRIELTLVASDGLSESEELRADPITVTNAPPRITSTPGAIGADGRFRYAIEATDVDGDRRFGFRLLEGPDGMALDPVDGVLSWSPTQAHAGTHPVQIEVDDRRGGKATQSFKLDLRFADEAAPAAGRW